MKTILVIGPVTRRAGYGEQARFALRSLRAHEDRFNILIQDIPWGQSGQVSEDNEEQKYIRETIAKTQQHLQHQLPVDMTLQGQGKPQTQGDTNGGGGLTRKITENLPGKCQRTQPGI